MARKVTTDRPRHRHHSPGPALLRKRKYFLFFFLSTGEDRPDPRVPSFIQCSVLRLLLNYQKHRNIWLTIECSTVCLDLTRLPIELLAFIRFFHFAFGVISPASVLMNSQTEILLIYFQGVIFIFSRRERRGRTLLVRILKNILSSLEWNKINALKLFE